MVFSKRWIAVILAGVLLFGLTGCTVDNADNAPTLHQDSQALALYEAALKPIAQAACLQQTLHVVHRREIGAESYTGDYSVNATYSGLKTDAFQAYIEQTPLFGSTFTAFYTQGTPYCVAANTVFSGSMSQEEFLASQIPATLLNAGLYENITAQADDTRTVLHFSHATDLEDWVKSAGTQFLQASGTVTLDAAGQLLQSVYTAQYQTGDMIHTLEITGKTAVLESANLTEKLPDTSTNTYLNCFQAPKILLQAMEDISAARAITCDYQESLVCEAASLQRTQKILMDLCSAEDTVLARMQCQSDSVDYSGAAVSTTQTELFLDGKKTVAVNSSEPVVQIGYTPDKVLTDCLNTVFSAVFPISYISDASAVTVDGKTTLSIQGSSALADALCGSIYSNLQTGNLDGFSDSYVTGEMQGYLTLDSNGLPIATGISLSRTHTVGTHSYLLSYKLEQSLTLGSTTAYQTIVGESAPEQTLPGETETSPPA